MKEITRDELKRKMLELHEYLREIRSEKLEQHVRLQKAKTDEHRKPIEDRILELEDAKDEAQRKLKAISEFLYYGVLKVSLEEEYEG